MSNEVSESEKQEVETLHHVLLLLLAKKIRENTALRLALKNRRVDRRKLEKELSELAKTSEAKRRFRVAVKPILALVNESLRAILAEEMLKQAPATPKIQ